MAVIIMNLLIGLTVSSIEELNKKGEKTKAMRRLYAIIGSVGLSGGPSRRKFAKWLSGHNVMKNFKKRYDHFPSKKVILRV